MGTESQRLRLRCVYIKDDSNRHSFQVKNLDNDRTVPLTVDWFETREQAEEAWAKSVTRVVDSIAHVGAKLVYSDADNMVLDVPPNVKIRDDGEPEVDDGYCTVVVASVHDFERDKYGVCMSVDGRVAVAPDVWFDTMAEAREYYAENLTKFEQMLADNGYYGVKLHGGVQGGDGDD